MEKDESFIGRRGAWSGRVRKTIPALFAALLIGSAAAALPPGTARNWSEDLDQYARVLEERHIDLYHAVPKAEFLSEVEALKARLHEFDDVEVVVELMRLTRRVGDGHTAIPLWDRDYQRFPFEVVYLDGQVLVVGASTKHRGLLGARLISIDGHPVREIADALSGVVPFVENPYSERIRVGGYFMLADLLHALGMTAEKGRAEFVFDLEDGSTTLRVDARAPGDLGIDQATRLSLQSFEEHHEIARGGPGAWASSLDAGRTVFVYLKRYPDADAFDRFGQTVVDFIDENQSTNLIIDLRDSYGGDFFSGLNFASWLVTADSIDWRSGVYTLIGHRTFSAAMSNSVQFRQILNARLVGQPTGARPCGYQDGGSFHLDHSGLLVLYSKRRYCFEDTHAPAVTPSVSIPLRLEDYLTGRDRVMEWVLEDIGRR